MTIADILTNCTVEEFSIGEHGVCFITLSGGVSLTQESLLRYVGSGEFISAKDHLQQFGLPAPYDAEQDIRRYNRGEESAVWKVYFAATHESNARDYHADLIERWAPHDQDMSQWADRLAQKNPFVAVVGDEIVGMAEVEPDGFIDYFYVHPRWQNQGIGKALLATLESEAAKLGVQVMSADVSITAKSFFLSKGFSITEAKSNVILGHPAPNFRMQKRLSSEQALQATLAQRIQVSHSTTGARRGADK